MVLYRDGRLERMAKLESWDFRRKTWMAQQYKRDATPGNGPIYCPQWTTSDGMIVTGEPLPDSEAVLVRIKPKAILCAGFNLNKGLLDERAMRFVQGNKITVNVVDRDLDPKRIRVNLSAGPFGLTRTVCAGRAL